MKPLLLILALLAGTVAHAQTEPPPRIGKITLHVLDVYSSEEVQRGRFYALADELHIETRRSVIAKFLLFREGDVYRPERLAETERNLRALQFLKSASVVPGEPHDGVVDVTVTTQDGWSIAPETQAGSKGGTNTYGATLMDTNLLGFGKSVDLGWDKGVDRSRMAINYNDPAFFAPYWRARFGYAVNSDGNEHQASVGRPFYSFATPWSTDLSFTGFRRDDRLYGHGVEVERFRQRHREIIAAYGVALDPNDDNAHRVTAGIRFVDDDFFTRRPTSTPLPLNRELRYIFLNYSSADNEYIKLNFVNKDLRFEDFNLGRRYTIDVGVSPPLFGADRFTSALRLAASDGKALSDGFILPTISLTSRFQNGPANTIVNSSLLFVRRGGTDHPRVLVGHIAFSSGWRLDGDQQFFADGLTGLRGYRAHAFEGGRSVVFNLEQRLYLGREILQLISPGVVAFVDAGNATNGGLTDLMHLKTDIGVGIRIGLPRTPKNLLRFDLAYALNRDPLGRRGWLVAFASGQAF